MNISEQMKIITGEQVKCAVCGVMVAPAFAARCNSCKFFFCSRCWEHHMDYTGLKRDVYALAERERR